jgi:hypothetical protein
VEGGAAKLLGPFAWDPRDRGEEELAEPRVVLVEDPHDGLGRDGLLTLHADVNSLSRHATGVGRFRAPHLSSNTAELAARTLTPTRRITGGIREVVARLATIEARLASGSIDAVAASSRRV